MVGLQANSTLAQRTQFSAPIVQFAGHWHADNQITVTGRRVRHRKTVPFLIGLWRALLILFIHAALSVRAERALENCVRRSANARNSCTFACEDPVEINKRRVLTLKEHPCDSRK